MGRSQKLTPPSGYKLSTFDQAYQDMRGFEGGYSNHPKDAGGKTMSGVTQDTYNGYLAKKGLPPKDVRSISEDETYDLYKTLFWDSNSLDDLPPRIARALFDFTLNTPYGVAPKEFQRIVGASPDGKIGPKTILATGEFIHEMGEDELLNSIAGARKQRIEAVSQPVFKKGLRNRTDALTAKLLASQSASQSYQDTTPPPRTGKYTP